MMPSPDDADPKDNESLAPAQGFPAPEEGPEAGDPEETEALAEAAEALAEEEELEAMTEEQALVPATEKLPSAESIEDSTLSFIRSFNRQLDQIQEVKDNLEAETAEQKKEIAARDRTVAQQQRRLLELEQAVKRIPGLEEKSRQLQSAFEERDRELDTIRAEARTREATVKQKDSLIAELNASHDTMVSKTADLKEEIQTLREERAQLAAQAETLSSEKEEILAEKRRVEQAMNQLDAKYQATRDEVLSAKKILGELQSAFETSQRKARAILDKKLRGPGAPSTE